MRRTVAALAVVVLALTACGGGGESSETKSTIKLYNDKGAWEQYFEEVGTLSKQETGIGVQPVGYTDAPTYQSFIKASFRTKDKPDLFTWQTGATLQEIVQTGQVAETSDIWRQGVADGDLTEAVQKYYTYDGKQYCVPLNVSYWVMFYNKKVFAEAGVQEPKTWADLMDAARTLEKEGVTPFYQTNVLFSFVWFQQLLIGTDPELYEKLATGDAKYTDPGVVAVMEQWKSMIDEGLMSDAGDKTDPGALITSGKVAMVPDGTWFNTTMTQNEMEPGKDYGMFAIPNVDPDLSKTSMAFESGPLCSLTKAQAPATNEKFVKWWIGPEAQEQWANSRGDVSANPKVKVKDPGLAKLAEQADSGEYQLYNRYFEATPPPILTAALDGFGAFLAKPETYEQQLQNIQREADDYWKKNG